MSKSTYSPILPYIYSLYRTRENISIAILDYGCGDGTILDYFSELNINTYDGIEVNKDSVAYGNKKYEIDKRVTFYHINNTSFPKKILLKKYDLVLFLGVSPYMTDDEIAHFFEMANKVMNKNGTLAGYSRTDHFLYSITDLYQIFLPHMSISTKKLLEFAQKNNFKKIFQKEMGLLIAPVFNNTIVLFFDGLDKVFFRTKGTLGPFGKTARSIMAPIIDLEQSIPINYGYKTYFVFQK